ncbi:MAG: DNA mismatch repair protein [Thermoanaerobaculia bacterium]
MIPVPDLLHPRPRLGLDGEALAELLEAAFLGGGDGGPGLDRTLAASHPGGSTWRAEFFRDELFLDDLVEDCCKVVVDGNELPVNRVFLRHALVQAPCDLETVRFRQAIVRELEDDLLRGKAHDLYGQLFSMLSLFKAPMRRAKLDVTLFRLEILEVACKTVDFMETEFAGCGSGLLRLHQAAREIRASPEYGRLEALLDFDNHLARLRFRIRVGADGRVRDLVLEKLAENVRNPFYRGPWTRLKDRLAFLRRGYEFSNRELLNRTVHAVFGGIGDWLKPLLQLLGHLAFYLSAFSLRDRARAMGLEVSLAEVGEDGPLELAGLFNPLLFRQGTPVPCSVATDEADAIVVITGPNSGGKTRLLQAIGLAQLLGQSGLYTPAARARLPLVDGLFASSTEGASVDQLEGRLGTELIRIRDLFGGIGDRSLVLMDELCSGTNPSEATRIVLMVLELLREVRPVAFITTHVLDFGRELADEPPVAGLQFLQVAMRDDESSTYQFVPGVAATSLASATARRLGVDREELRRLLHRRGGSSRG